MNIPTSMKLAGAAAVALASSSLFAEIALNEQFAVSGYVVGSARWVDPKDGSSDSTLDLDAYKFMTVAKFEKVSITGSLYAGSDSEPYVLDAYGTYDFGNGYTVTAGKFLSWLGYESFDAVNMNQLTYANENLLGTYSGFLMKKAKTKVESPLAAPAPYSPIDMLAATGLHIDPMFGAPVPGYHTGIKAENNQQDYSIGLAVLDSVYGPSYYKGDGDLDNGIGCEGYFTYKGVQNFTFFAGLAYETQKIEDAYSEMLDEEISYKAKYLTADFWVQYAAGANTFAAEFCWARSKVTNLSDSDGNGTVKSYFWALIAKHAFDEKWSLTGRISGTTADLGDESDMFFGEHLRSYRYTIAPTYAVTKNLDLVAEYSYIDYQNSLVGSAQFLGLQARFKF